MKRESRGEGRSLKNMKNTAETPPTMRRPSKSNKERVHSYPHNTIISTSGTHDCDSYTSTLLHLAKSVFSYTDRGLIAPQHSPHRLISHTIVVPHVTFNPPSVTSDSYSSMHYVLVG
ncbi:hypothetical protein E2C01_072914 [Portunus trituberculatus]|uniref:Uncharacterized protein n=1 Tax=Portunus trituberculatus TaxID=210409 RepID=A0A5B7IBY8_PORTR|nr:hypothetical protein [Portunus trituberculatus]